jgi:hypothetical protein
MAIQPENKCPPAGRRDDSIVNCCNATKFAVEGWSEALWDDLRQPLLGYGRRCPFNDPISNTAS